MSSWENSVALLIIVAGLAVPAPLGHPLYALAGVLMSAAVARLALAAWRLSGLPPFRTRGGAPSAAAAPPSA